MPSAKADRPVLIRPPRPGELAELSLLCLRSKAVWGYSAAFLAACRPALTLRPDDLATSQVAVADRRGHAVGVMQVSTEPAGAEEPVANGRVTARLDKLYVEPQDLRRGIGRALLAEAARVARAAGAAHLVIDADPSAAGFFRRLGAADAGEVGLDCVPGHLLSRLILAL